MIGKTALITGATGGIGQAIAKAFIEQGAKVIISGTRENVLEELKASLLTSHPKAEIITLPCNLAKDADTLFAKAEELAGQVDILVNNAGITKDNLLMRMSDDEWQDVIHLNLTSCFKLCRSAVKSMIRRRFGRIINITSIVGVTGNPGQTNYCASKAGMIGFSKALAQEIASRNITVNCVAPGFIDTDMTKDLPDAVKAKILSSIPQGKMGTPEDIASAILFLAAAPYITGHTLHVNGGMAMV